MFPDDPETTDFAAYIRGEIEAEEMVAAFLNPWPRPPGA
jgi:Antitoxin VbhA